MGPIPSIASEIQQRRFHFSLFSTVYNMSRSKFLKARFQKCFYQKHAFAFPLSKISYHRPPPTTAIHQLLPLTGP
jgi:hypothetical protein